MSAMELHKLRVQIETLRRDFIEMRSYPEPTTPVSVATATAYEINDEVKDLIVKSVKELAVVIAQDLTTLKSELEQIIASTTATAAETKRSLEDLTVNITDKLVDLEKRSAKIEEIKGFKTGATVVDRLVKLEEMMSATTVAEPIVAESA